MPAGLKTENYLLNCRLETISLVSKQAPRIFQTSQEHPSARIIITSPYTTKPSAPEDLLLLSKAAPRRSTLFNTISEGTRRASARKRTITEKYVDDGSISNDDSLDEVYTSRQRKKPRSEMKKSMVVTTTLETITRRRGSINLLKSTELSITKRNKIASRPSGNSKLIRRLDISENEKLYETLQKQITIELLKRRYSLPI